MSNKDCGCNKRTCPKCNAELRRLAAEPQPDAILGPSYLTVAQHYGMSAQRMRDIVRHQSRYYFEDLNTLSHLITSWRVHKGFDTSMANIQEKLLLLHTEVSEMTEDVRAGRLETTLASDGKPEGLPAECADLLIRVFDIVGALQLDIASEVALKMEFNETRPHKHGKKF